ncbi:MAG TPA: hypothetical protein PKW33_06740 [Anaerolineaceae bacterium]|nr:hypothetical protein [Anaerolineaceae bacterium]HPN51266.1 hypothetical protein [Anaerolineaceae bacterium]
MPERLRRFFPLVLLGACGLAYGLLIPMLGFYWDDLPINWIFHQLGPEGLARYFSTNRPVWGLLYQITLPLLGSTPWHWQVFALLWRWLSGVLLWLLLRRVWPDEDDAAEWVSLLAVVYPAFGQQFISLVYSHFFMVLCLFFGSLLANVAALQVKRHAWLWHGLAVLLSLGNLVMMEYFFVLELARAAFLWVVTEGTLAARLRLTLKRWLPYLGVMAAVGIWRTFFFSFQTTNYKPRLLTDLSTNPLSTLWGLCVSIYEALWNTTFGAWAAAFAQPDPSELGSRTTLVYFGLLAVTFVGLAVLFAWNRKARASWRKAGEMVLVGAAALLAAGWPFWLTGLRPRMEFPADRFTLPFMLGACLLLVGLVRLVPAPRLLRVGVLAALAAASVGFQFQLANAYKQDWETQRDFFWQLAWRAPAIEPDTVVLANEMAVTYYSDNSLSALLNWYYAPDNHTDRMSYMLYYPSRRFKEGTEILKADQPLYRDYLAATFTGSTSSMVAVFYAPWACLRVLDPLIDGDNRKLPVEIAQASAWSRRGLVLPEGEGARMVPELAGAEPSNDWCYYFEKAELARQRRNWEEAAAYGDAGLAEHGPKDPAERFVFIESYANVERWDEALTQTREVMAAKPELQVPICRLWQRIELETQYGEVQQAKIKAAKEIADCAHQPE